MNQNQAAVLQVLIETLTLKGFSPEFIRSQVEAFVAEIARFAN